MPDTLAKLYLNQRRNAIERGMNLHWPVRMKKWPYQRALISVDNLDLVVLPEYYERTDFVSEQPH